MTFTYDIEVRIATRYVSNLWCVYNLCPETSHKNAFIAYIRTFLQDHHNVKAGKVNNFYPAFSS